MNEETRTDPWDEVEGIPWEAREYRTPPGEERSWETTLDEIRWLVVWLSDDVRDFRVHMEMAFDSYVEENIAKRVGRPSPRAEFRLFEHIRDAVEGRIEVHSAVQKLLLRLLQKVHREARDTLQASQSGLDE